MPLWGTAHAAATNNPKFLPASEDSKYNKADCYATQSGLSSDDEEERGLAIIEAIKDQTYGNDDTELDTPFEEETESYEETASY